MYVVLSFVAKSACAPVGGQEPKVQSACGITRNQTAYVSGIPNVTSATPTNPSVGGHTMNSIPFTGATVSIRVWAVGPLSAFALVLMMMGLLL